MTGATSSSGLRSGVLLILIGGFLILRTVSHDSTGRTLIDRILGKPAAVGDNATNAQLDTLGQGANTVIAPNALSGQMGINNARLRVQAAIRGGTTPAAADVATLQANVPGFSLAALKLSTPRLLATGRSSATAGATP